MGGFEVKLISQFSRISANNYQDIYPAFCWAYFEKILMLGTIE